MWEFVLLALSGSLVALLAICCWGRIFGKVAKHVIQSIDRSILGVDVYFGHLVVDPCKLKVKIEGCTVANPRQGVWSTPHLMKMDRVFINVGMRKLLRSCGRRVSVQTMELDGVEVLVEKTWNSSNVWEVLALMGGVTSPASTPPAKESTMKVDVHAVKIQNVRVNLHAWKAKLKLRAADFDFQDLTSELEGREAEVILTILIRSMLESVLANLPGGLHVLKSWKRRRKRCSSSSSGSSSSASSSSDSEDDEDEPPKTSCCRVCK